MALPGGFPCEEVLLMNSVCVFCGSSVGKKAGYLEATATLGTHIADLGMHLVYGGADVGLMGMVAKSCLENGGKVTGVMPKKLVKMEVAHSHLTDLKIVESMHERKALMADLSDGFIALPGGIGTLEETFEMFTWVQLGIHQKPIGLLNIEGFFDGLIDYMSHVADEGFMQKGHLDMLIIRSDPKELMSAMNSYQPLSLEKWRDKKVNKINLSPSYSK